MIYDKNNIFAKILRGEIPCKKIYEDDCVLAFHDVNPQKKIHALVIPKGEYINLDDFTSKAPAKEILALFNCISIVAQKVGVSENVNGKGYRALVNVGKNGGQEVPHLHFHIFGGEKIGRMVS
jgi:histidine triad (HIT) family protein